MAVSEYERNKKVVAKLWIKQGRNGEYMSGFLQDYETGEKVKDIVGFPNRKRPDKNDPDYLLMESKPLEQRQSAPKPTVDTDAPW